MPAHIPSSDECHEAPPAARVFFRETEMDNSDLWRLAAMLIQKHGNDAETYACLRAEEAEQNGNNRAGDTWRCVATAVFDLEKVVMTEKKPTHVRLPQRSEEVIGPETKPGETPKPPAKPDPRTITQDPALKPH
jgi:hypothetical protein